MHGSFFFRTLSIFFLFTILFFSHSSFADGLSELKQALKGFTQSAEFTGHINASIKNHSKEDDEITIKTGATEFAVEQNQVGLEIRYPMVILDAIDKEIDAKKQNPKAQTPRTEAMNRFNYQEMVILLNPVLDMEEGLRKAKLIKEENLLYQGKSARLLHLQIDLEKLSEEERKNLKKFKTDFKIWIDEKGVPLASHSKGKGSGRFALVIGFEFHFDVEKTYTVHNNRLLVTQLKSSSGNSGGGMSGEEVITASLKLD
jgi:hypothetical protein